MNKLAHRLFLVPALCAATGLTALAGSAWELPPVTGDQNGWGAVDNNWTWDKGNPLSEDGATWSVEMQTQPEPTLTAEFEPMPKGLLYNFVRAWVDGSEEFDPEQFYKDRTLVTKSSSPEMGKFPEKGKSSAIIFKPEKPGTYHIQIEGAANVQNKTAGYVLASLYVLSSNRAADNLLQQTELNAAGGMGDYPDKLSFEQDVDLGAGDEFAVRIQAVSPGAAPVGSASLDFKKFTVTKVK